MHIICEQVDLETGNDINEIEVEGLKELVFQFADDTNLFIDNTIKSLNDVLDSLTVVENNIELTISYEKSKIHLLSDSKPVECSTPVVWDQGGPDILGIKVFVNENPAEIYTTQIQKMCAICEHWLNRNLPLLVSHIKQTLIGRII